MKYLIHPVEVPRSLASRYTKPVDNPNKAWSTFKGTQKVQESLIPAQNHLCSYCEVELTRGEGGIGYHIEHIKPKSKNPDLTFKFSNLLISCFNSGNEISPSTPDPNPVSCGHAKKSEFNYQLFIMPTSQYCESYFFYELDGRIVPNPNLADSNKTAQANYTINLLNLNCRRLKRARSDMISEGLNIINGLLSDSNALSDFAELELMAINNKFRPFFTTRRQYFHELIIT